MTTQPTTERFHALDATRAFALLLGVVFHAVWFFTPEPMGTPVKDVSANHFFGWFFHTSHTFRMQLFFLIAGFFAALVIARRGAPAFASNRFKRIVVPLVLAWIVILPLTILVWTWGKNVSGQSAISVPPLKIALGAVTTGSIFETRSQGGAFGLVHLWFLYFLSTFYVVLLIGRASLLRFFPKAAEHASARAGELAVFLTKSPLGALTLAAIMTPLLWSMKGWSGVDTPGKSLIPLWNSFAVYFLFFLIGWFLYRQAHRLPSLFQQWKLYLGCALLLSIGLYVFYAQVRPFGGKHLPPHMLAFRDVQDWNAFRSSLAAGASASEQDETAVYRLWHALPQRMQNYATAESTTYHQRMAILIATTKILADPDYLTADFRYKVGQQNPRKWDSSAIPSNRAAVQPFLNGVAAGDYREATWYEPAKLAFSAIYAVVMVFLVYGCLGAFQACCQRFNAAWRYLADSSYWVYLAHIPLLPALEIAIFDWQAPGLLKLVVLCAASFALLYGSYHYLVRSSLIGKLLNGKAHSFVWNPLEAMGYRPSRNPQTKPPVVNTANGSPIHYPAGNIHLS